MRLSRILAGLVEFALQVLLGDLHIAQGHADVFVAEQLHQRREADPQPHHLGGIGMAQAMGRHRSGATGSLGGLGDSNSSVVSGTDGFSQMDMINTMNQNNLQLLELQAVMQSNMQQWNTKSNILSADHRARMAMIEKFTAR